MPDPHQHKPLCKVAMFLAGFIMLTPHRIAMTCAPHILKRYHLPPDVVGLFIYKIHAPMELSGLMGQLITNVTLWICRYSSAPKNVFRGFSIGFGWIMFFSSVLSFILLYSGDDYGKFNEFFWSIILLTFTNGLYCASAFKLEGMNASMYGAGIPSSGFFTFFLHKYCKSLSRTYGWSDFDHSILLIQFWVTVITLGITTTVWFVNIGLDIKDDAGGTEEKSKGINKLFDAKTIEGHAADWSPIGMLACSLGTVYFFYPSISPYQLVDSDAGKKIDLWVQFTAAIPNFGVAILDIIDELAGSVKCGPSGKHWKPGGTGGQQYYYLWHLSWLAIIPYILCIYIFMSLLHFPDGFISRLISGNPIVIGLIGNTFNFFQECLESIGFAGAGAQGTKSDGNLDFNDNIAAFNVLFTYIFMVISMFIEKCMRIFLGNT